jgi:hypothetical protein
MSLSYLVSCTRLMAAANTSSRISVMEIHLSGFRHSNVLFLLVLYGLI